MVWVVGGKQKSLYLMGEALLDAINWRRDVTYFGSRLVPINLSSQMAMARPIVRVVKLSLIHI